MKATSIHPFSQEEMMAYLDGELTPARMLAAARHLDECVDCQQLAENLRQVSETLTRWEVEEAPSRLAPGFGSLRKRVAGFWLRPRVLGLSVGAIVVLVAGLASVHRETKHGAPTPPPTVHNELSFDAQSPAFVDTGSAAFAPQPTQRPQALQNSQPSALIVRTAELTIVSSRFEQARASLERTAAESRGYIAQLEVSTSAGTGHTLDATLRIPAAELQTVVERVKGLGRVESESQGGEDVTQRSVDLNARLSNLETTETRLLQILREKTGSLADVLQVEEAVDRTRGDIEVARAEGQTLSQQVALASLRLRVSEQYRPSLGPNGAPISTRLRNAAVDGYRNMIEIGTGIAMFLLSAGPTLLGLAAISFFPARWLWKRSRRTPALPESSETVHQR